MFRFLLATLFCLASLYSQASQYEKQFESFPIYEEVYAFLDKKVRQPCFECQYNIAKKKDGYYLVINNIRNKDSKHIAFIKVWDAKSKQWSVPNITQYTENIVSKESGQLKGLLSYFKGKEFGLFYVYGYEGYAQDVIDLLRDEKKLSTVELEMLARSYSQMSTDNIHFNQYGNSSLIAKKFDHPLYSKTSPQRVEDCMKYADSSLVCYEKIQKENPNYEPVIIDHVGLKINHDRMHYYHILMSVREEEKAKKYLNQVNYSKKHLDWSKHYLSFCDKDAIFIANGDTDTYTLWYLQLKEGYRTDVAVINKSLMQTKWYMMMLVENNLIKSSFSRNDFTDLPFHRYSIDADEEGLFEDYSSWVGKIKDNISQDYNGQSYPIFTKNVRSEYLEKEVNVSLKSAYLAFDNLCHLDIMAKNSNRPVYISTHINASGVGLIKNLVKLNTVYQIVPETQEDFFSDRSFTAFNESMGSMSKQQLTQLRNLSLTSLQDFMYGINRINDIKGNEAGSAALHKFQKKVSLADIAEFNHFSVFNKYSLLLKKMDSEENDKLKKQILSNVKSRIVGGPLNKFELDDYVADLKYALYLYSSTTPTTMASPIFQKYRGKSELTSLDMEVLEVLGQKTKQLLSDPFYKNLSWSLTDMELVQENVEAILGD